MKRLSHPAPGSSTLALSPGVRRRALPILVLAGLTCGPVTTALAAPAPPEAAGSLATDSKPASPQARPQGAAPAAPTPQPRSLTVYFPENKKAAPQSPITAPRPAPPPESPFVVVGILLALVVLVLGTMRLRAPLCPRCKTKMARLEPVEPETSVDAGEGSASPRRGLAALETLACPGCDEVMRRRFRTLLLRDPRCPACGQPTKVMRLKTEDKAGYLTWGRVHVEEECKSCDFRASTPFAVPPLEAPVRQRPRSRRLI